MVGGLCGRQRSTTVGDAVTTVAFELGGKAHTVVVLCDLAGMKKNLRHVGERRTPILVPCSAHRTACTTSIKHLHSNLYRVSALDGNKVVLNAVGHHNSPGGGSKPGFRTKRKDGAGLLLRERSPRQNTAPVVVAGQSLSLNPWA